MKYLKRIFENINSVLNSLNELNYILEDEGLRMKIVYADYRNQNLGPHQPPDHLPKLRPNFYSNDDIFILVRFPMINNQNGGANVSHLVENFFISEEYLEWFDRAKEVCSVYKYILKENGQNINPISVMSYNYDNFVIAVLSKVEYD